MKLSSNAQILPKVQPISQPTMKVVKNKPVKMARATWTHTELWMTLICGVFVTVLLVGIVATNVMISQANKQLTTTQTQVENISSRNANLKQEINELTSHTRLQKIANKYDLQLTNQNIRNVNK
ncbi:cell division protein FtsL [Periweissella beninensis]|uniref:cell division protein FtsL n=1 Tax=Periweissella beninensis TaxID=504936 RepID=UPI0021A567E7|nr:cell division protein FtsL [Periweissella beninensis]MCT4396925.1 cell division protein FtsL [Periweissella beninensis]